MVASIDALDTKWHFDSYVMIVEREDSLRD